MTKRVTPPSSQQAPRRAPGNRAPTQRKALLAICDLVAPGLERAAKRVALAYDEPATYAKLHASALRDRSVDGSSPNLPWIALIDALIAESLLASTDWKTDYEDLAAMIGKLKSLPRRRERFAWAGKDESLDDRSTAECLELIGSHLANDEGLVLAHLDIDSDEYELIVVPTKAAKQLALLAKKAGYGSVELFLGANLASHERARIAKAAAESAREALDPNRQQQFVHPDGRVVVVWGGDWMVGEKRHYSLDTMKRPLGVENTFEPPGQTKKVSTDPEALQALRKREIEAWAMAGFVEVSRETFVEMDNAATRKRTRLAKAAAKITSSPLPDEPGPLPLPEDPGALPLPDPDVPAPLPVSPLPTESESAPPAPSSTSSRVRAQPEIQKALRPSKASA